MAAEQKLVSPGFIAVQFNRHANCTTATVDTVVLGKFQAACISRITVELTTFLLCVLTIKQNGECCRCFMARVNVSWPGDNVMNESSFL